MTREPYNQPFDSGRPFVVHRPFTYLGVRYAPNDGFDPGLASVRRLRQMFEQHLLKYAGTNPGGKSPQEKPGDPDQAAIVAEIKVPPATPEPVPNYLKRPSRAKIVAKARAVPPATLGKFRRPKRAKRKEAST